ncbi:hypothetical protein ACHAPO_011108 [Fusarium lateritium]
MTKNIVILGAGFAGIPLAHKLLQHTIPKVEGLKLILVSASTHLYWNIAAVRAVVPGQIPEDELFQPIEDGFTKYKPSQFELIIGRATGVNLEQEQVTIDIDGTVKTVNYHHLILATGSSVSSGLPFKHVGSSEDTKLALRKLQERVKAAKSIVIAGDGPTGVETAGEIAEAYGGEKKITLIVSKNHALPGLLPSVGQKAEKVLSKMNTTIIRNVKVVDAKSVGSSQSITLSDGKVLDADVYLPLFGLHANSSFLPPVILDDKGNVKLDNKLRVTGTDNVWGVGDIGNLETKQATKADAQLIHLAKSLDAVLVGNSAGVLEYKKSEKPMIFVTLGKKTGTGQMGNMKAFGWMVSYVKGRTLFVEKGQPIAEGKSGLQGRI